MNFPDNFLDKEFTKGMRGYNAEEVDEFMDEIKDTFSNTLKLKSDLENKAAEMRESLSKFKDMEKSLSQAIIQSQHKAGQTLSSAEKESKGILENARNKADEIRETAVIQSQLAKEKADSLVIQAENESTSIINDAKAQAEELLSVSTKELKFMEYKVEEIKSKYMQFIQQFNSLLNTHIDTLQSLNLDKVEEFESVQVEEDNFEFQEELQEVVVNEVDNEIEEIDDTDFTTENENVIEEETEEEPVNENDDSIEVVDLSSPPKDSRKMTEKEKLEQMVSQHRKKKSTVNGNEDVQDFQFSNF